MIAKQFNLPRNEKYQPTEVDVSSLAMVTGASSGIGAAAATVPAMP